MTARSVLKRRRVTIAAEQGNQCCYCRNALADPASSVESLEPSLEHIVDRKLGGSNEQPNLVVAHRGCNSYLHATPPWIKLQLLDFAGIARLKSERLDWLRSRHPDHIAPRPAFSQPPVALMQAALAGRTP